MTGEVLGLVFSMTEMTWNLGLKKKKNLADGVWSVAEASGPLSLQEMERLAGRVFRFAEVANQESLFTSSLNQFLGTFTSNHEGSKGKDRMALTCLTVPEVVKNDGRVLATFLSIIPSQLL